MYQPSSKIEEQAICEHMHTEKEVMLGAKTGDRICTDCGECIIPGSRDPAVEYRGDYIVTTRELAIVLSLFSGAKIKYNYRQDRHYTEYPCAVVNQDGTIIKPVLKNVADRYLKAFPECVK
jgi:hypothetical protein